LVSRANCAVCGAVDRARIMVHVVIAVDVPMTLAASALQERHTLSFWDALVVEAARRAGASRLLSEDFQAGRRIGGFPSRTQSRPTPHDAREVLILRP
jgi:predicted nucleic acid-binding protein